MIKQELADFVASANGKTMVTREVLENAIRLLKRNPAFLTAVEKQRQFITARQLEPRSCSGCGESISNFDAAPADWDGVTNLPDDAFECPHCQTPLLYQLAFFGGVQTWVKRI
jgi:hypothetical protein